MYLSGCYETEIVNIKVRVEPEVSLKKYRTIAVMDFFDERDKYTETHGKIIARMIRKELEKSKDFYVIDERDMELEDGFLTKDKLDDLDTLVSLCGELEADALIIGTFDFRQIHQPMPYIMEGYSRTTGRYDREAGTYIQEFYSLSFHAIVIDGKTGKPIFNYSPPKEQRPKYRNTFGIPFTDDTSDPAYLRTVASIPVRNFILSLMPHYKSEQRILVK